MEMTRKRKTRTQNELEADRFDLQIYHLISKAMNLGKKGEHHKQWAKIAADLTKIIRPRIRAMMNKEDQADTN